MTRHPALCVLATVGLAPLVFVFSLAPGVVLTAVAGLCFAPISVCQNAAIGEVADAAVRAEAFSRLGTAYGTRAACAAGAAGRLVGSGRLSLAFALAASATGVSVLAALAIAPRAVTPRA